MRSLWDTGQLRQGIPNSLGRGALGFIIAVAIGTPIGLLMGRVRLIKAAIGAVIWGLQSLPSVAWVPAAIIWFGITPKAIISSCCWALSPRSPLAWRRLPGSVTLDPFG